MNLDKMFVALTGKKPTPDQRDRLEQMRKELNIGDNDALWAIFAGHEYYLSLYQGLHDRITRELHSGTPPTAAVAPAPAGAPQDSLRTVAFAGAVAGFSFLFGGFCVYLGFVAGSRGAPAWMVPSASPSEFSQMLAAALRAPAGWMAFAAMLPALALVARLGLRLRNSWERSRKVAGWACLLGAATATGCVLYFLSCLI